MNQSFEKVGELFISPTTMLYSWNSERKNFEFLQTSITEDEEIKLCFGGGDTNEKGKLEGVFEKSGLVLITNKRILIGGNSSFGQNFNEIKFTKQTIIQGQGFDSFFGNSGWIHIKDTNHEIWIGGLWGGKKQVNRILEVVKEVISSLKNESILETVSPYQSSDNLDKIKKLKELFDLGVISQEEFDSKKNKLLEGI
uniref:SHOCT domain-containing protein n=1 Tax=Algoriphagus sp. TaxID=1872435 RepID=UPI0040486A95